MYRSILLAVVLAGTLSFYGTCGLQPNLIAVERAQQTGNPNEPGYCWRETGADGVRRLIVTVQNHGGKGAPPTVTRVNFEGVLSPQEETTPALTPTDSVRLAFPIPEQCFERHDPNCEFTIRVDAQSSVAESDEKNTFDGTCMG